MDSQKITNSKIYQFFDFIMRLILLNLLTLTFSLPIITIPTSVVACHDVIKQYINGGSTVVFRPFWESFKSNFKKTIILSIGILIIALLLANSVTFFYNNTINGGVYLFGFYLTLVIILVLLIILVNYPLTCIYFQNLRAIDYLKLSTLFGFKDLAISIIIVIIYVAFAYLGYLFIPFFIFGGISVPVYLILKISRKHYYHISKNYE